MFHFGGADQFLPIDQSDRIAAAFANRDAAEVHVQPGAGHAFDNFPRANLLSRGCLRGVVRR